MKGKRWQKAEFQVPAEMLAPRLLGQYLVRETPQGRCVGRIVEAEAYGGTYQGQEDDGAHSFHGLTKRTAPMFASGGITYVYLIYGRYHCLNIVAGPKGKGEAVLLRALEPIAGLELMQQRRQAKKVSKNLTNGPGKLCQALAITRADNACDLEGNALYLLHPQEEAPFSIVQTTRINIDYATNGKHFPWRFYIQDNQYVSKK